MAPLVLSQKKLYVFAPWVQIHQYQAQYYLK